MNGSFTFSNDGLENLTTPVVSPMIITTLELFREFFSIAECVVN